MKTKVLLIGFLSLLLSAVQAQFVNIPDARFRAYLIQKHPACFNSSQAMDTTCPGIVNDTVIEVMAMSIIDLNGAQYFDNLRYLNCFINNLTSLPPLPSTLTNLHCTSNKLTKLPTLPSGLRWLQCASNKLTDLPLLPGGLEELNCRDNLLTSLPVLPDKINQLVCAGNQLTSLPNLPIQLQDLDCSNNQLSGLPALGSKLRFLSCGSNQLTTLPLLPASLYSLECSYNNLTSLPALPQGLINLLCNQNRLTHLPSLSDSLSAMDCSMNPLSCLPYLPQKLQMLSINPSPNIKCFPNLPAGIERNYSGMPICNTTNNPAQCRVYPALVGKLFYDSNKDGIFNSGETLFPNKSIRVNTKTSLYSVSNAEGRFLASADTLGTFVFAPDAVKNHTWVPSNKQVAFGFYGEEIAQDFGLQAQSDVEDLAVKITAKNLARPGFPLSFELTAINQGTVSSTASPSFHFPKELTIDSISSGGNKANEGSITWPSIMLKPFQESKLRVHGRLSVGATLGSEKTFYAQVNPSSTADVDMSNNRDSTILIVRGSFDPNDKAATPFISPNAVASGTPIDYTVRFQNTGTDTAFTVVVQDTLSAHLQHNTLEVVSTSHNCRTTVRGNVVSFEFFNIHLLWTSFNEPLSHGYVRYRIKPKTTLALGTKINNQAGIYFDYNVPIITNTVTTEVGFPPRPLFMEKEVQGNKIGLHPNPTRGEITLSEDGMVDLYDLTGVLQLRTSTRQQTVDLASLTKGVYFLKLTTVSGQVKSLKVVRE